MEMMKSNEDDEINDENERSRGRERDRGRGLSDVVYFQTRLVDIYRAHMGLDFEPAKGRERVKPSTLKQYSVLSLFKTSS